jgi:geranylgeranyl diphosphate synthase type I
MDSTNGWEWSLPVPKLLSAFKDRFDPVVDQFFDTERIVVAEHGSDATAAIDILQEYMGRGGKRIRPLLACAGFMTAGGTDWRLAMELGVGLELLHTFALIHDDLMDRSDVRRGQPTLHRWIETQHPAIEQPGSREHYGVAMAIVLGDLALMFADDALNRVAQSDPQKHRAIMTLYHTLKIELVNGQILDMRLAGFPTHATREDVLRVMRYKTGKYTVERPLHLGALLGGASPKLLDTLSKIAIPMGMAFQLQDDLLGVFGDPTVSGKPVDSDLREGKVTLLVVETLKRVTPAQRKKFLSRFGNATVEANNLLSLRAMMEEVGAQKVVEKEIQELLRTAESSIDSATLPKGTKHFFLNLNQFLRDRVA